MHITHIIPALPFGGAERTVIDIINLAPPEFTFSIVVFSPNNPMQALITRPKVQVVCVQKKGQVSFHLFGDIKKVLQKLQPDVVHTHLFGGDLWGRVAARSLGIPVVSTEHNVIKNEGFVRSCIKRYVRSYSDISVACSQKVKEEMIQYYGMNNTIEVVRPGVQLTSLTALPLSSFSSPLRFLMIGRLGEQKAQETGIRALARQSEKWQLSIVGNGPLESHLKNVCKELGVQKKVQFFPATPEVASVYGAHDIVLMPSLWEGLSLVAMEALAAGRALLVSNVGGMSEIIDNGKNGFLLKPIVEDFAQKIEWCFSHTETLKKIGEKARLFAQKNCSAERMVAQYTAMYKKVGSSISVSPKKKNIHVVHIIPRLGFGGAERFVVELAKHLSEQGIRQTVVTLWDERPLMGELPKTVKCVSLDFDHLGRMQRIGTMVKLLRDIKATIVHTHLFSADVWGRLAARSAGLPVVTTEHNINKDEPKLWEWIKRFMKHYSKVYTAPSAAVIQFMHQAYKISPKHIRLIAHGIDLKKFSPIPPAAFESPFTLIMVGRLVPQKGHKIALDALKELRDLPCKLVIVGSGELEKSLKKYAEQIGVGKSVEWRAATRYIPKVYQESDIVLMPSLWEGLGIVVLEAMASGRLVIASNVDGIRDSIQSGVTGVLVPPQQSSLLAQAIRKQLTHSEASLKMAEHGREWATVHANVETMAAQYKKIYQEL